MLLKHVIIPDVNQRTFIQVTSAGNNSKILAATSWSSSMTHLLRIEESYLCKLWLWKGQWGHNTNIFLWRKGKSKQPTKNTHIQKTNQPTNNKNKLVFFCTSLNAHFAWTYTEIWMILPDGFSRHWKCLSSREGQQLQVNYMFHFKAHKSCTKSKCLLLKQTK